MRKTVKKKYSEVENQIREVNLEQYKDPNELDEYSEVEELLLEDLKPLIINMKAFEDLIRDEIKLTAELRPDIEEFNELLETDLIKHLDVSNLNEDVEDYLSSLRLSAKRIREIYNVSKVIDAPDDIEDTSSDLKDSSRFQKMMELYRTYAKKAGATTRGKLLEAAEAVEKHYNSKYKKKIEKEGNSQKKGYDAACKIINEIKRIEYEIGEKAKVRKVQIESINKLLENFKSQIDKRKSNGTPPIDMITFHSLKKSLNEPWPASVSALIKEYLREAQEVEGEIVMNSIGNPPPELRQKLFKTKALVCLDFGVCKPPKETESGASDSFFLKDHEGAPTFIFKPTEGEADQTEWGWEKDGAAPREILASDLNDELKKLGLDCGISKSALVTLEDPSLKNGKSSSSEKRTGALQEFAPNDGSLFQFLGQPNTLTPVEEIDSFCTDPQEIKNRKSKINKNDLQKIALFDFVTLNLDRSPPNILVRNEGVPPHDTVRLIPIDGGNLLPCRKAFGSGAGGMGVDLKKDDQALSDSNGLMQLPLAFEEFSDEIQKQIDILDPDMLSETLKDKCSNIGETYDDIDQKVKPEVFDMMRLSVLFLKRACGSRADPKLTPADVSEMYQNDLNEFFKFALDQKVPPSDKEITEEMDRLIKNQVVRKRMTIELNKKIDEFDKLGGDMRLVDLGWKNIKKDVVGKPTEESLELLNKHIDILTKNTDEPKKVNQYDELGGDDKLSDLLEKYGNDQDFNLDDHTVNQKINKLETCLLWKEYDELGGDDKLKEFLQAADSSDEDIQRAMKGDIRGRLYKLKKYLN